MGNTGKQIPLHEAMARISQLEKAVSIRDSMIRDLEQKNAAIDKRLDTMETYRKHLQDGEGNGLWFWQGNGDDHLESMVDSLRVVITAGDLKAVASGSVVPPACDTPEAQQSASGELVKTAGDAHKPRFFVCEDGNAWGSLSSMAVLSSELANMGPGDVREMTVRCVYLTDEEFANLNNGSASDEYLRFSNLAQHMFENYDLILNPTCLADIVDVVREMDGDEYLDGDQS